jgi:hypothetical protein
MSSPWSPRREVSPETSRLLIERAHEELLAGNAADQRLMDVRPLVRESWRRSLDRLVGAEGLPPLDLGEEAIDEYRRAHPLAGVMDMVRGLLLPGGADDSGVIVAIGDAAGRLLWVEGDRRVRTLTGDMGFVPGANWSEDAVGTSAPGTALALGRSVQIRGAEHFNRLVQPWSCSAAPVHDPETRRILGVIDVTGGVEAVTPQAQLLVDATARAIEGELLVARLRARADAPPARRRPTTRVDAARAVLRVLGRDRALLELAGEAGESVTELGARHAELLLMLAVHRQGLSAERLGELVYGDASATDTLRPELVRLRKHLERVAPQLVPASRPYRLTTPLETDAHQLCCRSSTAVRTASRSRPTAAMCCPTRSPLASRSSATPCARRCEKRSCPRHPSTCCSPSPTRPAAPTTSNCFGCASRCSPRVRPNAHRSSPGSNGSTQRADSRNLLQRCAA